MMEVDWKIVIQDDSLAAHPTVKLGTYLQINQSDEKNKNGLCIVCCEQIVQPWYPAIDQYQNQHKPTKKYLLLFCELVF